MARLVRTFQVLTPAGTALATPQLTSLAMPARLVRALRIRVPPGPAGTVGIALTSGGQQVIPETKDSYLVLDNEVIEWPLEQQIESGAWQLRSYNTGRWDHTVYLTFLLDPVADAGPDTAGSAPLDITA